MATQAYLERYRQLSALDQQKNDFIEVPTNSSIGPLFTLTRLAIGTSSTCDHPREFLSTRETRP